MILELMLKTAHTKGTMPRGIYKRDPNRKYGVWSLPPDKQSEALRRAVVTRRDHGLYQQPKGEASPLWKGGRIVEANGYVAIYRPAHPGKKIRKMYVYEHRYVLEKHLGRPLRKGEEVHHNDGDRTNNSLNNLRLFASKSDHLKFHWEARKAKGDRHGRWQNNAKGR